MCGICGYVAPDGVALAPEQRSAMQDAIRHRGPDEPGELHLPAAAGGLRGWFGHRRLKILDLTPAARQPMVSDDGQVVLTYNGEVYNFRELRRELERLGFTFRSDGDTEVVLRAYEAWGEDFMTRLDGMFALAVWDARTGRLLMSRDRTGKKPLYYAARSGGLAFASEIKSLHAAGWVARTPDLTNLPEQLVYGYVPSPRTLFAGVMQVPPGSRMTFDRDGLHGAVDYWSPLPVEQDLEPSRDVLAEIAELLADATRRRMISDVPLGALLSGGIDSSVVVGLMQRSATQPVRTFSIGFPEDPSYDERRYARQVAEHFGTEHTEFAVSVDAARLIDRLLWFHDQPFHDSSAIPTYTVAELAREHVTVVLNGDGGDEVFGGYDRFRAAALARRYPTVVATAARRAARTLPRNHGYYSLRRRAERFLEMTDRPLRDRYLSWISVFTPEATRELVAPHLLESASDPHLSGSMDRRYDEAAALPELDQVLYANFRTYLPDDLAVKMDRMSMAHGLEARSPFLDTALIEYVARIRADRKVGRRRVKPVLREACFSMLPREIWNRRKHGFGVPMGTWLRGQLGEVVEDELLSPGARSAEFLDQGVLRRLWAEHLSGEAEHGVRFWTAITLERWLRSVDAPLSTSPPAGDPIRDAQEMSQGAAT